MRSQRKLEQLAVAWNIVQVKPFDFRADLDRKTGGIKSSDASQTRPARAQILPRCFNIVSNGRDHAQPRNRDATFHAGVAERTTRAVPIVRFRLRVSSEITSPSGEFSTTFASD